VKQYKEQSRKSMEAKVAAHGGTCKAHGGAIAHKGKGKSVTKVNIVVAPRERDRPVAAPVSGGAAAPASVGPSRSPVQTAPVGGLSGLMARGGRAHRAHGGRVGHFEAGAGSGVGRLEKTEHVRRK
jgi:hypothetical protein